MAVARFAAPDKRSLAELAGIAKSAELRRVAKELERGRLRHGLNVELTAAEMRALHERRDQAPPRARACLDRGLAGLVHAEAYEAARDARVKPRLAARRRELQEQLT